MHDQFIKKRNYVPEVSEPELNTSTAAQIAGPSDRLKRRKGKGTTLCQEPEIQRLFPLTNNTIIKYSGTESKDAVHGLTQPVIQHKQLITTEQQLCRSQSTLEKLDAFKCKPHPCKQIVTYGTLSKKQRTKEHYQPLNFAVDDTLSHPPSSGHSANMTLKNSASQMKDLQESKDGGIFKQSQDILCLNTEVNSNHFDNAFDKPPVVELDEVPSFAPGLTNNTDRSPTRDIEVPQCSSEDKICFTRYYQQLEREEIFQSVRESNSPLVFTPPRSVPDRNITCFEAVQQYTSEYETIGGNISKECYLKDTFDAEVCDSDLLQITFQDSGEILPDTIDTSGTRPHILDIVQMAHENTQITDYSQPTPNGSRDKTVTNRDFLARTALSDAGDRYYIDEIEEEELLRLTYLAKSAKVYIVTETSIPSISIESAIFTGPGEIEVYDSALQFSLPKLPTQSGSSTLIDVPDTKKISNQVLKKIPAREPLFSIDEEDWSSMRSHLGNTQSCPSQAAIGSSHCPLLHTSSPISKVGDQTTIRINGSNSHTLVPNQKYEYEVVKPFARPVFPKLILDRSPVLGLSASSVLRVCFRIGEMYKEGARCSALDTDAVLELFARVGFSSREPGTVKQHFQFLDLWHDRLPITIGILANYKTTTLAENESKVFIEGQGGKMARCLGRLKRDPKSPARWLLHIINIRETDWEEISWTRRIVSGDCSVAHGEESCPEEILLAANQEILP